MRPTPLVTGAIAGAIAGLVLWWTWWSVLNIANDYTLYKRAVRVRTERLIELTTSGGAVGTILGLGVASRSRRR